MTVLSLACLARAVYAASVSTPATVLPSQSSQLAAVYSSMCDITAHSGISECSVTSPEYTVQCTQRRARGHRHGWRTLQLVIALVFGPGRDAMVN